MERSFKPRSKVSKKRAAELREHRLKRFNRHINFTREGRKGNARKDETEVTCCRCRERFILPFKPRFPEVYCDKCFKKHNQSKTL